MPVQGRATQGVRVMRVDDGEHVAAIERLAEPGRGERHRRGRADRSGRRHRHRARHWRAWTRKRSDGGEDDAGDEGEGDEE